MEADEKTSKPRHCPMRQSTNHEIPDLPTDFLGIFSRLPKFSALMIQGYRGMMTDRIMVHGPSFSNWWLLVEEVVEVVEVLEVLEVVEVLRNTKARQTAGSTLNFHYKAPHPPLTPGWPPLIG